MRLLTVLLPAMKAPSAPTAGAKNGQTPPTFSATHMAMAIGIDGRCDPSASWYAFTPELM